MKHPIVERLRGALAEVARRERAEKEKQYLKSDLAFIGVDMPTVRRVAKASLRESGARDHDALWTLVDASWAEPVHELRAAAIEMLLARRELLVAGDLGRLERMVREARTWALLDPLATAAVGHLVERFATCARAMDRWSRDDDFWVRRAAVLSLLVPLRQGAGDFERFCRYADAMLEEKEFFIRKAIGWVLRETSKKRPELVRDFIEPRLARASGVTVREAVKYLPERDALLARFRARHGG